MVRDPAKAQAMFEKELDLVTGPEAITITEALDRFRQALHPEVESITVMPIDVARQMAEASDNHFLKMFANLMYYFQKVGEPGDPREANILLGAPVTRLDVWIEARKQEKVTTVD